MMSRTLWCSAVLLASSAMAPAAETHALIAQIKAVGKEGKGNVAAGKAWRELVQQGPAVLPEVLAGLDDASPIAANWLRSAVDAVAARALAAGTLAAAPLEGFVRDTKHAGHARRLAYEWLVKVDAAAPKRLLPGMVNDPGQELRREAVDVLLKQAQGLFDAKDEDAARAAYQKILEAARDHDQVKFAAQRLDKLGVTVDLTNHLGFITRWALAGPFDNVKGIGFRTAYLPERGVDLKAVYDGKDGRKVRWLEYTAEPPATVADLRKLGLVDLNKMFTDDKAGAAERMREATVYCYSVVEARARRPVEIRAGSNNALRIWLNGEEIFFREEYHHGVEIDQHVGKGTLRAGRNEILVKICQNHQDEAWARQWSFQLRICDAIGGAVPVTVVTQKLPSATGGE
ncbi:MAG: hypothetical protein L0Y71_07795 [Gemmataceae bacterium]|nr:hypothetical protein [Gemmataceae bacterium]